MNQTESKALSQGSGGTLSKALAAFGELLQQDLSRNRFAEEREWYEEALFYQRRQWLKWDSSNKRWSLLKQDPDKPRPMPVTNHFARTVNANANQLAGGKLKAMCVPNDDSDRNRAGSRFAEKAIAAIDEESGMILQNPLLGKHTALWGIGVTKDTFDRNKSNGVTKVPVMGDPVQTPQLGCLDCGQMTDLSPEMTGQVPGSDPGAQMPGEGQAPCPYCGGMNTTGWMASQPTVQEVKEFANGKIVTEVRPIFEWFLPRDCTNANLAKKVQHKYRLPISRARECWPDKADELTVDEKQDTNTIYLEALRSLVNYNYMHEQTGECITVLETYIEWSEIPVDLQDLLEQAVADGQDDDGNEVVAPDEELDPVEQLHQFGIFLKQASGEVLEWGINPNDGDKPPTFFLWEVDPANTYPKGIGSDLIPLQKRLNRLDSLIELCYMSNAAGKWLWPSTLTVGKPTGSPSDVIEFDPIGDGKMAPQFVAPTPIHASAHALRQSIKQDFLEIGMTEGVGQGSQPEGVSSFRGLAYLGAKAAEQISTQRILWETAHALRHKKCLRLAKKNWTEPRMVKVAGFNGRWGMKQILGSDLEGDYTNTIVEGSSRPKTLDEKAQQFATLLQGGLIDPLDPATREYVLDEVNLDRVNLADHLQYAKAERDLDKIIAGEPPVLTPYMKLPIFYLVFGNFTLTEDFEELDPQSQARVMQALAMIQQQMQVAAAAAQLDQMRQNATKQMSGAMAKQHAQNGGGGGKDPGLSGVPGQTTSTDQSSAAAEHEGASIASAIP
jgi:hypothetical protein